MRTPDDLVAFVRTEQPKLVRACDLLLDDHAVAEEIAQEALIRAAARWERIRGLDSPGGWVHRVAINLATSTLRRRQIERRVRARVAAREDAVDVPDPAASTPGAIEVRRALRTLPAAQQELLVRRHVLGERATDLADDANVRPATMRQRLRRAREGLRDALGPDGAHLLAAHDPDDEEVADVR
ncbi:MAG: sigma-70 family RNA polymerase sigma factor [Nitriliruptoraceae bacterium]|nr:sigma-70 family RNA polymerase sigma factor [Nitriliruptoraceae bacterium]